MIKNSDKWLVQSSIATFGGSSKITLLKPYKDTNYVVYHNYKNASNSASTVITWHSINSMTTDSFTIQNSSSTTFTRIWTAMGFTA